MKETIFISHANPEDNYFAFWLACKLSQAGYKVWVDVNNLVTGDSTWPEIEKVLREDSIRFIAVISQAYISKARMPGSGIRKELACASVIKNTSNFILPVRLDQSEFSDFSIDLLELYATDFYQNWKSGLTKLLNDLETLKTAKSSDRLDIHNFWAEALKIKQAPVRKIEQYRTNWFSTQLPEDLYVYELSLFQPAESKAIFSYVPYGNRYLTFASEEIVSAAIQLQSSVKVPTSSFLTGSDITVDDNLVISRPNYILVQLLNSILKHYLLQRGLCVYEQANKREVFYFENNEENIKSVSLKRLNKTRRTVIGKLKNFIWHFGISFGAALFPMPMFKISYHVLFSDERGALLSKDDQHLLRRNIGADWFNRKWLETLLAMMVKISGSTQNLYIEIPAFQKETLKVMIPPLSLYSEYGYAEPSE